jgi:hypothetical protein
MSKIEDTANALLYEFGEDSKSSKKANEVLERDPFIELKLELFSFFKERIGRITAQEKLREKLEQELETQIETGTLSFDQLLTLYNSVSKQNNISSESLISLFKPTPGVPSILAANLAEKEEKKDIFDDLYDKFNSDHLQKIDKLSKVLSAISKETSKSEED